MSLSRRRFIAGTAAVCRHHCRRALCARAEAWRDAKVVPHADLKILDPIWTTAYITRNHGYMVYDTLFALDHELTPRPQMVDKYRSADDTD